MSEMTVVEVLKRTYALIESGWTQHAAARDAEGATVTAYDGHATRFCLNGALQRACAGLSPISEKEAGLFSDCCARLEDRIHARCGSIYPEIWNDQPNRQQSEVLALIEETIICLK